jgi:hypothetical protein
MGSTSSTIRENLSLMVPAFGVVLLVAIPWQWLPSFELGPLERETAPRPREEHAPERTTLTPPATPARDAQLADDVVVRALDTGRSAFVGCWKRALKADPMLDATKVKVRVEVDETGAVVNVTHDATNEKLGNCLTAVSRGLRFAAPENHAVAEFPLFFQPE